MKYKTLLITLALPFFFATPAFSATSTPSATTTPNMADQVKLLVQENLATTEAKLKEKVDLQSIVGFVGKISTISSQNLTLDSHGNLLQITTSTKTTFQKNNTTIKLSSLAIGDKVIVIGTSVKEGIVSAKRVTVIKDEPILVKTTAVIAKVVATDIKKKTLTLSIDGTDQILTLSKKSTVRLADLQTDQVIFGIIKEYEGKLSISRAKVL